MTIAYIDCFAGVSGDMLLGALIDLGIDFTPLQEILISRGLPPFSIEHNRENRRGLAGVNVTVIVPNEHIYRTLSDIISIINDSKLSESTKQTSIRIFTRIAEAESRIHQKPVEQIHFHEIGAVDSIVDIIGTVWGLEQLGIIKCYSSAITLGSGSVECQHGIFPVPAPATVELVKGFPVIKREVGFELATPTGTAILTTIAEYCNQLPPLCITRIGYGCGDRDIPTFPNVLRIIIGTPDPQWQEETMLVMETNIDDLNPEIFPYVMERLFSSGAADVYVTPVMMKKGRLGYLITVLTASANLEQCLNVLFAETSTLGVRICETHRRMLERTIESIASPWGTVSVKSYMLNGKKQYAPEYEECKKIAQRENIPLKEVYETLRLLGKSND
jgi:hypothetical protein